MMEFSNATVVKKANVYFNGKVTSRTVKLSDGSTKTLGFMLPGEYEFNTGSAEIMEALAGSCRVLLPGEKEWRTISEGQSFDVPASSKFKIVVTEGLDYCCSFASDG